LLELEGPSSEKIIICVVYKKPTGKKHYLNTYKNLEIDSYYI
jgi:hypothetical protein